MQPPTSRWLTPLLFLLLGSARILAQTPEIVYRWDAADWLKKYNQSQFQAEPITNPDGTIGARVIAAPRSAQNPYNHIIASNAGLKGGNEYTAAVTFSVVEPTVYPCSFFLFARNSVSNGCDIWRTWVGLPGPQRTVLLPLDLKEVAGGTWQLHMGISKAGGLNINSIIVYRGATSDGARSFVTTLPASVAVPAVPPAATSGVNPATGFTPFKITPPATPATTLSMADYHFVADDLNAAEANAVALQKALRDCKGKGGVKLVIPKGVYRLSSLVTFGINDTDDLTIDGQGSVLISERRTKEGPAFTINNCSRVVITNMTLDWDWDADPIAALGTVSNLSADRLQCDMTFPDQSAARTNLTRTRPWKGIYAMDPVRLVASGDPVANLPKDYKVTPGKTDNALHLTLPSPIGLVEGGTYCIRHLYYEMGGFKIVSSSDLTFNSVNIYSMPGMGWFFAGAMRNFQLSKCNIVRAPNSRNPFTTAADGFHVGQFIENFNVEDCRITGTGDDTMNFHTESYQGKIVPDPSDPSQLTLENCPSWQLRIQPGDPLEFYNGDFSPLGGGATPVIGTVASVKSDNKGPGQTIVRLTQPVPAGVTPLSIIINGRFKTSNLRIANCEMVDSSGRAILLSAKNATIENCRLSRVGTINLESEIFQPLWSEGRGASNVLIRNNLFDNMKPSERYNGAVIYTNTRFPWGPTKATLYDRITIEKNTFVNSGGPIIDFRNCSSLIVRDNVIKATEPPRKSSRYVNSLFVTETMGAMFTGNRWIGVSPALMVGGVIHDPATTSKISVGPNFLSKTE